MNQDLQAIANIKDNQERCNAIGAMFDCSDAGAILIDELLLQARPVPQPATLVPIATPTPAPEPVITVVEAVATATGIATEVKKKESGIN